MARRSQGRVLVSVLSLASLLSTGCIVAEAPDYGGAQQSPPFMSQPHPNPTSLQELTFGPGNAGVAFSVNIRSEDAGEPLAQIFSIDYKQQNKEYTVWTPHDPSTFDQEWTITYTLAPSQLAPGTCHSISIMATHISNWDGINNRPKQTSDDFVSVTWFVAVEPVGVTLVIDCPTASNEKPS